MQISSRFTVAVHIFACIHTFGGERKVTSEFLAMSTNVNPVIIRKILSQLIHVFECRSEHGSVFTVNPFGNPALFVSVLTSAAALAACIWWEPLSAVMQTFPLSPIMLAPAVIFAAAVPAAAGIISGFAALANTKKRRR